MSCEELKELYELYALSALEPEVRQELDEHLARQCPNCVPGVKQARLWTSTLGYGAAAVEPPARLRGRVLAAVGATPEKGIGWNWLSHAWAAMAVGLLLVVIWYGSNTRMLQTRLADLAARNRQLVDALALVSLPESQQLTFGGAAPAPPRGRIWVHPQRGVLLLASRLPQAPAGKVYEMWIVPKSGAPIAAGLFQSNPQGEAMHVWTQTVDVAAAGAVAVTLEAEGGAPAPTSTPLIVAAF
jgi:anti-sigma-K factor RskA